MLRGGAVAARRAHNPKVPSSNLGPATSLETVDLQVCGFLVALRSSVRIEHNQKGVLQ